MKLSHYQRFFYKFAGLKLYLFDGFTFNEFIKLLAMIVGYARVSSTNQNIDLQINALKKYGVDKIYMEKQSAVKYRPELDNMLDYVRAGDTVVVWKLDRIARSLKHLIDIVEKLKSMDVNFVSITESIDTTTSLGKFFLQINGSFAELERNLIIERTKAGLQVAREKGHIGGRKPGLSPEAIKKAKAAKKLYLDSDSNYTVDEICTTLNIGSKATLYRYLKYLNVSLKGKN